MARRQCSIPPQAFYPRAIQTLLGHASIITAEIYTHVAIRKIKTVHANTHPRA
jgi:site-specific recombinase XerD